MQHRNRVGAPGRRWRSAPDSSKAVADRDQQDKTGVDTYLNVFTAQTSLLGNQQTAITLQVQQMTSSVQLIEALGGGWDTSQLPSEKAVARR